MEIFMNKFAERLKQTLYDKQISQSEFARKINMSQSLINNYCAGRREPTLDTLLIICKTLNESADYMIGLTDL